MFIIYDLIFLIFTLFYLPIYTFQRKFHSGFSRRLGILPSTLQFNHPIWIHAVSVGEVIAVSGLLQGLRSAYPEKKFVVSTVTLTGNKIAKGIVKDTDFVTYLPLDFSFIIRPVIDRINPSLFIIAETEIWPNLISYLHYRKIPIIVVNGRISDHSFQGYLAIKFILKSILSKIDLFCMQTERDAQRLVRLGAIQDRVRVIGNIKFDIKDYTPACQQAGLPAGGAGIYQKDYTDDRVKLGLGTGDRLFIAGSTHPQEEKIILSAYKKLLSGFPNLKLLIAPRHPQRSGEIAKLVYQFGFRAVLISKLASSCDSCLSTPVFILDCLGELRKYYATADIVFVGGSLVEKGGHNILEPASLAKPIIFGPYMFNFRQIADLFLTHQACILVQSQEELEIAVSDLLNDSLKLEALAKRAKELILQNQGATHRTVALIKHYIDRS